MKPHLKYGLIVTSTGIILSLIAFIAGLDKSDAGQYIGWLNIPIMIVLMVMAIKEMRTKFLDGFITFGQAFKTTSLMVLISSFLTAIYTYLYFTVINPSMVDYIREKQIMGMEERGMSSDQIDQAMAMSEKFMSPVMMTVFAFLGGILLGIIAAAIVSAIVKKPNPNAIS